MVFSFIGLQLAVWENCTWVDLIPSTCVLKCINSTVMFSFLSTKKRPRHVDHRDFAASIAALNVQSKFRALRRLTDLFHRLPCFSRPARVRPPPRSCSRITTPCWRATHPLAHRARVARPLQVRPQWLPRAGTRRGTTPAASKLPPFCID